MYRIDTVEISLVWGRIGAGVLLFIASGLQVVGYVFSLEQQEATFTAVSSILASIALIQVIISKVRESKKVKKADAEMLVLEKIGKALSAPPAKERMRPLDADVRDP